MSSFGEKIHAARTTLGLTLAQLGMEVGLPESSVQRYEKGIYPNPTRSLILKFSRALAIPLCDLMCWGEGNLDDDIHLITRNICELEKEGTSKSTQLLRFIVDECVEEEVGETVGRC